MLLYMLIAAAALTAVRFFQYMSLMDFATGYYIDGAELGGALIYILLGVFAVGFAVLSAVSKKKGNTAFSVSSDGMGGNATRVLGFSEVIAAGLVLVPVFEQSFGVQSVGMIVAGAALIISGFTLIGRIVPPIYIGHLHFLCAVYMLISSLEWFNTDLTVLVHSDNLIVLIAYVLNTAMLASIARFYLRFETKASRTREIITAGIAFVASSAHIFPKLAALAFGGSATAGMSPINYDICAGLVLSLAFIITVFCTKKNKDIVYLEDEDAESKKKKKPKTADV